METMTATDSKKRMEFIGGSDIAAVMGLSRWVTPLKLWAEKTGKIQNDVASEAAELGTELEEFVAKRFTKMTTMKVRRDNTDFTHPEYSYMRVHIDRRIIGTDLILECKTCSAWKAKEWDGEEIPIEYTLQVNWELGIVSEHLGRRFDEAWLAVLIGGQRFIYKAMKFDEDLFRKQVEFARTFWEEFVLKDQPPMAISGDSEALLALFPKASGELVKIEDKEKVEYINSALEHRSEISREIDEAMKEKDDIDSKLKQIVGETPGILTDRFKITWTPQVSRRADPEAMKKAGVFDQFSKETSTRVLRVTQNKEKKGE